MSKRILSLVLSIVMITSVLVAMPVSATTADFTFSLLANGKSTATIKPDEYVDITLGVSKTDNSTSFDLCSIQDIVLYDPEYLELVSAKGYQNGGTQYISTLQGTNDSGAFIQFSRNSETSTQVALPFVAATIRFKALKEGSTTVQSSKTKLTCAGVTQTVAVTDTVINIAYEMKTLTFVSNGGTEFEPVTVKEGTNIRFDNYQPTKKGFLFKGWFFDQEFTHGIYGGITLEEDTTLYAKWVKETFDETTIEIIRDISPVKTGDTINFTINMGPVSDFGRICASLDIPDAFTYVPNSFRFADGLAEDLGFDVLEWLEDELKFRGSASAADYNDNSYTTIGYFQCTVNKPFSGSEKVLLTDLEIYSCETFADHTERFKIFSQMIRHYDPNITTCTLTFHTNGGTPVAPITVDAGRSVMFDKYTTTKSDAIFDGWYKEPSFKTKLVGLEVSCDATVYAKWRPATIALSFLNGDPALGTLKINGSAVPTGYETTFPLGEDVTISVEPAEGYYFVRCTPYPSGSGEAYYTSPFTFTVTQDVHYIVLVAEIPKRTVSGTVNSRLDANEKVTVELISNGNTLHQTTGTTSFSFGDILAGDYTLRFSKANHATYEHKFTLGEYNFNTTVWLHPIGDFNGDGTITSVDAARANAHAQHKNEITDSYQFKCLDVVGSDSTITTVDVMRINSHVRGTNKLW